MPWSGTLAKTTSRTKQKATTKGATTADGNRLPPARTGRARLVGGAVDRCAQLGATTPAEPLVLGSDRPPAARTRSWESHKELIAETAATMEDTEVPSVATPATTEPRVFKRPSRVP